MNNQIITDEPFAKAETNCTATACSCAEVSGRSAGEILFVCAWCGAINYAEERGSACYNVCYACGRTRAFSGFGQS